ncbi:Rv2231c family pyridoxal phosphate-dependent protein CobC [uncultured Nocardioides sp.]|uniref:Rv2231c family pyridoxal phosphate-dependent protein CobC n=1 Tax=uncultured Nocardioides sp. TaxID=198441 RepID=UPI0026221884|nr:Rv2231c family pyridoxal phosphate-dependent protein CobC [uncultured Nocardioides sp.]
MAEGALEGAVDPGLLHHGDAEVRGSGLLDLAVNVHPHGPPDFLREALRAAVDDVRAYPDPDPSERTLARLHGRAAEEVLVTAGATEAFTLVARMRPWRRPVVVHPQFTEPHAALLQAGHRVQTVFLPLGRTIAEAAVPEHADLVVVGNPTNPTGTLHPREEVVSLLRPGRVVLVDEAFMDAVPGEEESWAAERREGLVVVRSLTKTWAVPGVRAGYLVGDPTSVDALRRMRPPWSFSTAAAATVAATSSERGVAERRRRAVEVQSWRAGLQDALERCGVPHLPSAAPFVLARPGAEVHGALRSGGVAVRRCDTFPGLGPEWVRIAARPPSVLAPLVELLRELPVERPGRDQSRPEPRRERTATRP